MDEFPSQIYGCSNGGMYTEPVSSTNFNAFWLHSSHAAPPLTTSAPSSFSLSITNCVVVSGTNMVTGTPSCFPEYAAASPALPPDEHTNRGLFLCFTHM
uniref:Uncharacterized protein n=1 Tax=Ciona intestinalis TaxID=7719 RepID=H2XZC6_CIOIN